MHAHDARRQQRRSRKGSRRWMAKEVGAGKRGAGSKAGTPQGKREGAGASTRPLRARSGAMTGALKWGGGGDEALQGEQQHTNAHTQAPTNTRTQPHTRMVLHRPAGGLQLTGLLPPLCAPQCFSYAWQPSAHAAATAPVGTHTPARQPDRGNCCRVCHPKEWHPTASSSAAGGERREAERASPAATRIACAAPHGGLPKACAPDRPAQKRPRTTDGPRPCRPFALQRRVCVDCGAGQCAGRDRGARAGGGSTACSGSSGA